MEGKNKESGMYKIEHLNHENYKSWSFQVKLLLERDEVSDVIEKEKPTEWASEAELAAWNKMERKAYQIIGLTVSKSQFVYINKFTNGSDAWNALKDQHRRNTLGVKIRLMRKLFHLKLKHGGSMREHLDEISCLIDELHDIGEKFNEDIQVAMYLSSLNTEYDNIVTGLEAWDDGKLKLSTVKSKLMEEYERKKSNDEGSGSQANAVEVVQYPCHFCKKFGHYRKNCPNRKKNNVDLREKLDNNKESAKMARFGNMYTMSSINNFDWIIDSGATAHMAKSKESFVELDESFRNKVITANGHEVEAKGRGTVMIPIHTQNGPFEIEFNEVLWVPDLKENLISVIKIVERDIDVKFSKSLCIAQADGHEIKLGIRKGNVWNLNIERRHFARRAEELCIHDWHKRLAHRNLSDIKLMDGIKFRSCEHSDDCESCIRGKMSRKPFPKEAIPTKSIMDCVVSDVCGPLQVESVGRKRYFVSFIDLHSRYCMLYFIREKSEVAQVTINYIEFMKTQTGKKPKILRTDRGTEYMNKTLQEYLTKEGIKFQCTVGYCPEQNGVAERKNRTIMEAVRSMLAESGLPKSFWAEAAGTANYTFNRMVDRKMKKSPYEMLFKEKPRAVNFYEFGTDAYVMVPYEKRRKLDDKAIKMKFVGYDESSKGYRLVDGNYKIHVNREVKFLSTKNVFHHNNNHKEIECEYYEIELNHVEYPEIDQNDFFDASDQEENDLEEAENNTLDGSVIEEAENNTFEEVEINDQENNSREEVEIDLEMENDDDENDIFEEARNYIEPEAPIEPLRRSTRQNFGKLPERFADYEVYPVNEVDSDEEVSTDEEASTNEESNTDEEVNRVDTEEDFEPRNYKEAILCKDSLKWKEAMRNELEAIEKNNTWELVNLPRGSKAVGSRWVFKLKKDFNGTIVYKARLVAQGFSQRYGIDYNDVFAPVARTTTLRMLLPVSGERKYKVSHYDIKTAFLNGTLEEEIFLKAPVGFEQGSQVYKLKKSLYGLKQAANVWNKTLHNALVKNGCTQDSTDKCLYKKRSGEMVCYLLIHVDDMLVATNNEAFRDQLMNSVGKVFELKSLGEVKQYLGIEVETNAYGEFLISQTAFIDKIVKEAGMEDAKGAKSPIDPGYFKLEGTPLDNNEEYRALIGKLLYLSTNTRPDIAASVSILSQRVSKPRDVDLVQVKRLFRYIKSTRDKKLRLNDKNQSGKLSVYSDANWAEDKSDRKSNTGFICMLNGGTVSWCCRKQSVVALSSTEAEYIALTETCKEVVWLKELAKGFDIDAEVFRKVKLCTDNQSCMAIVKNENFSNRTKHIDARYHYIRSLVTDGKVYLEYVPTEVNIADLLTKPLGPTRISELMRLAGLL